MKRVLISILARVKGNVNANGTIAALTEIKKFFTTEGETRVYVSGRCVKYCIKERLAKDKNLPLSPLTRVQRVLQPAGNPVEYVDDDLFGYLIPGEERKRFAPIKTDGIVSLRHCEITRDFGGRFDPTGQEDPSPFEVEVADFIGQNNWILTENIGRFKREELTDEIIDNALKENKVVPRESEQGIYYLPPNERKNRVKSFLDVLLKERYTFPRSATGLHQPQYYYAVILFTNRLLPLFAHVDYAVKDGRVLLDAKKLKNLLNLLNSDEKIIVIDFEGVLMFFSRLICLNALCISALL